jgi:hypothetical protein
LKVFLLKTFQKFSIIKTSLGVSQEKTGLNMGSALGPMLSNIFVHALETKIVKKYAETGKLIHYNRFADDLLIIIHKNFIRSFVKEINNFEKSLNYTIDEINYKNEINVLDITVYLDKSDNFKFR